MAIASLPAMPNSPTLPIQAGIYGASGSTGTELAALLTRHPLVEIAFATSREHAGRTTRDIDPAVPEVALIDPDDAEPGEVDVVFTCLPHGQSASWVKHCHDQGARVIDLSGDLRLRDPAVHAATYGTPRSEEIAARAVYGLTEITRSQIADADIVSCPGCYDPELLDRATVTPRACVGDDDAVLRVANLAEPLELDLGSHV